MNAPPKSRLFAPNVRGILLSNRVARERGTQLALEDLLALDLAARSEPNLIKLNRWSGAEMAHKDEPASFIFSDIYTPTIQRI